MIFFIFVVHISHICYHICIIFVILFMPHRKVFFGRLCPRAFLVISICPNIFLKAQFFLIFLKGRISIKFYNLAKELCSLEYWLLEKAFLNSSGRRFEDKFKHYLGLPYWYHQLILSRLLDQIESHQLSFNKEVSLTHRETDT